MTKSVFLNGADAELTDWSAQAGDERIIPVSGKEAADVRAGLVSRALGEIA